MGRQAQTARTIEHASAHWAKIGCHVDISQINVFSTSYLEIMLLSSF